MPPQREIVRRACADTFGMLRNALMAKNAITDTVLEGSTQTQSRQRRVRAKESQGQDQGPAAKVKEKVRRSP